MADNNLIIRRGHYTDLTAVMDIWYANEIADDPQPPPRPALLAEYPHLLDTGELWIAEQAGVAVGFAGAVVRSSTTFLTDLFVDPNHHSSGLGTQLLHQALAAYPRESCFTVSSSDPRALALYTRYGMQPHWPNFLLRAHNLPAGACAKHGLHIVPADPHDPEFIAWDAAVSGRERPDDITFWVEREGGVAIWLELAGERVGYAIVRLRGGTIWEPHSARLGPVGARLPEHATAVVMAVVDWASSQAGNLRLDALGPHPGLAVLLAAGFRIQYIETFMLAAEHPFFDPRCYNGSGGALF